MAKAPQKPLMITPEAAAGHVLRCLEKRPLQLSVPRLAAAFVEGIRWMQVLRRWAA
jgi:hypothetical protein